MSRVVALVAIHVVGFSAVAALAQECPQTSPTGTTIASTARTLEGSLIYHDDIRKWFEIKLDHPQCRQSSIQLVPENDEWKAIEVLRGCRVKSTGSIDFSGTGYFSLGTWQNVQQIDAVGLCRRQLPFPDYSKEKPTKSVQKYRVNMHINYAHEGQPIMFRISSAGRELLPWQVYASYELTGGFVLYGKCAEGFVVDRVWGTPQANPSHFDEPRTEDDMATFDPESAAASGKNDLHLSYTCVRHN